MSLAWVAFALPASAANEAEQGQLLKKVFQTDSSAWRHILQENNELVDTSFFERCAARIDWDVEHHHVGDAIRFSHVADVASLAKGRKGEFRKRLAQKLRDTHQDPSYLQIMNEVLRAD